VLIGGPPAKLHVQFLVDAQVHGHVQGAGSLRHVGLDGLRFLLSHLGPDRVGFGAQPEPYPLCQSSIGLLTFEVRT